MWKFFIKSLNNEDWFKLVMVLSFAYFIYRILVTLNIWKHLGNYFRVIELLFSKLCDNISLLPDLLIKLEIFILKLRYHLADCVLLLLKFIFLELVIDRFWDDIFKFFLCSIKFNDFKIEHHVHFLFGIIGFLNFDFKIFDYLAHQQESVCDQLMPPTMQVGFVNKIKLSSLLNNSGHRSDVFTIVFWKNILQNAWRLGACSWVQ